MSTPATQAPRASYVQRGLWSRMRHAPPASLTLVRAVRLAGTLDEPRLRDSLDQVAAAFAPLHVGFRDAGGEPVVVDLPARATLLRARAAGDTWTARRQDALAILRADQARAVSLERDPLVRFHLIELDPADAVFAIAGHVLTLDLRGLYGVLGAVLQAYFGRFRPGSYPDDADFLRLDPTVDAATRQARTRWWSWRMRTWAETRPAAAGPPRAATDGRVTSVATLRVAGRRWSRLGDLARSCGSTSTLAVVALLTWWLRSGAGRDRQPLFGTFLDLRDFLRLGPMIGALSDRVVFSVDLDGYDRMTFRDLLVRTHAGLLDAVVHYLPYDALLQLAAPAGGGRARLWDVFVHYCPSPPTSSSTRNEASLARRGLSIELFGEVELISTPAWSPPSLWDEGDFEVHVAETGDDMSLVLEFDSVRVGRDRARRMLAAIDTALDRVIADPTIPARSLDQLQEGR